MADILLAWELGANFGHVARLRMLATTLRTQGHRCVFALRDLDIAAAYLPPALGPLMQAPLRLGVGPNPVARQASFASVLNNIGFDDVPGLAARLRAWRALLQLLKPSVLVADHSPTAVVAAQTLNLPCLRLGTAFALPPASTPWPAFSPEQAVTAELLLRNEAAVLQNLNQALHSLALPPMPSLQAALGGSASQLLSYAELDHYGLPRAEAYAGVPEVSHGAAPVWPEGEGPKLIAYLRPSPHLHAALDALKRARARVLLRMNGLRATELAPWLRPGLAITDQMLDMQQAAAACDGWVNYASHGFVAEMLLAGKPGLMLPDLIERAMLAQRVLTLGAGLAPPASDAAALDAALLRLSSDPALSAAAQGFAQRYAGHDRKAIPQQLAAAVTALAR